MSRPERLHIAGGRYFVIDEFQRDEVLVAKPDPPHSEAALRQIALNRSRYESQVAYAAKRWCVIVCTHCWLPDRALLELQIARAPLEDFMHSLRQPFSHYLHRGAALSGTAYASRYRAWLVDPRYIADLRRDILWRPVRAGLCTHPLDYPYATLNCACAVCSRSPFSDWATQQGLTDRQRLAQYLLTPPRAEFSRVLRGSPHDRRIIGAPDFVRRARRSNAGHRLSAPRVPVIQWVSDLLKIPLRPEEHDAQDYLSDCARALIAWLVSCSGSGTVSMVARWFTHFDRAHLQRTVDKQLRLRPDLFSKATLDQFCRFLTTVQEDHELPFLADHEAGDAGHPARQPGTTLRT